MSAMVGLRLGGIVLVASCVVACGSSVPSNSSAPPTASPTAGGGAPLWFEDVTPASGLRFAPDVSAADPYFMPKLTSGGAAAIDFDNDGWLDVFFAPGGPEGQGEASRLYRQSAPGRFEDVTESAHARVVGYGQGVAVGDVDNDGWQDLLVTGYGRVWLLLNRRGTFEDATKAAGLTNELWGTSAVFTDVDRDGWLDLFVVNYIAYSNFKQCFSPVSEKDFCGPNAFKGTTSRLYRNRGRTGAAGVRFDDVTEAAGLAAAPGPGLGVVTADFNGDGWVDLFVANDGHPNHVWLNEQNGHFTESGVLLGLAYNDMGRPEANMGIALGDVDGDGRFDLYVTHLTEERHRLWLQPRPGVFQDSTARVKLLDQGHSTGFGAVFADFDNDGDEDLLYVNGRVARAAQTPPAAPGQPFWSPYVERNLLFANDKGAFTDVTSGSPTFLEPPGVYRVVVAADFDNDGRLDALVTRTDGEARLFRNVVKAQHHWLGVRAVDPALHRDAYDAVVTIRGGGRTWTRWMNPGRGFASSMDPRAYIGLGSVATLEGIEVQWPGGERERFDVPAVDRLMTLEKGAGRPIVAPTGGQ